jgi:hypothetical protein
VVAHLDAPKLITAGNGSLEIKLKDGNGLEGAMEQPYGGPLYPLTLDQVLSIYRANCAGILADDQIDRTSQIILTMESKPDLQELFDICTFRGATGGYERKLKTA